jgi:hypothetical protein
VRSLFDPIGRLSDIVTTPVTTTPEVQHSNGMSASLRETAAAATLHLPVCQRVRRSGGGGNMSAACLQHARRNGGSDTSLACQRERRSVGSDTSAAATATCHRPACQRARSSGGSDTSLACLSACAKQWRRQHFPCRQRRRQHFPSLSASGREAVAAATWPACRVEDGGSRWKRRHKGLAAELLLFAAPGLPTWLGSGSRTEVLGGSGDTRASRPSCAVCRPRLADTAWQQGSQERGATTRPRG